MRKFGVLVLLLIIGVALLQLDTQGYVLTATDSTPTFADSTETIAKLQSQYDIQLSLKPTIHSDSIEYTEISENDALSLAAYLPLLSEEIDKYSVQELDESGLQAIYLMKDLHINTGNNNRYAVAGATDYSNSSIFIDITTNQTIDDGVVRYTPTRGCDETQFARGILHHELWHVYEYNNPESVTYDYSKDYLPVNSLSVASERCMTPDKEFVSTYAQSSAAEDRAEQFRAIMTFEKTR